MRRVFWMMAAVAVASSPAAADERRAFVVATGEEPACLVSADVAAAIVRHAAVPAQALAGPPPATLDAVEVRVRGGDDRPLRIEVREHGRVLTRVLDDIACPSIPDVVAAFVAATLAPLPPLGALPAREVPGDSERVRVLAETLNPYSAGRYRAANLLLGAAVIGTAWYGLANHEGGGTPDALTAVSGFLALAGTATAVSQPGDHRSVAFAEVAFALSGGTMLAGMALNPSLFADGRSESYALMAGGYLAAGGWYAYDAIFDPRPGAAELMAIRAQLRDPAQRRRLTADEVVEMEATFRRARPRRRYLVPPLIASIAGFAYAVQDADVQERNIGLAGAGSSAVVLVVVLAMPDPVSRFERRLRETGLQVTPAPMPGGGGLAIGGEF